MYSVYSWRETSVNHNRPCDPLTPLAIEHRAVAPQPVGDVRKRRLDRTPQLVTPLAARFGGLDSLLFKHQGFNPTGSFKDNGMTCGVAQAPTLVEAWHSAFATDTQAPFGGIKASGMGREGGTEAIRDYMNVKLAQVAL